VQNFEPSPSSANFGGTGLVVKIEPSAAAKSPALYGSAKRGITFHREIIVTDRAAEKDALLQGWFGTSQVVGCQAATGRQNGPSIVRRTGSKCYPPRDVTE